jgi:hypothetical protein
MTRSTSVPEPPQDPEEWTDDEWISYLEQTDALFSEAFTQPVEPLLGKVTKSSGGQIIGNAMVGMAQAIYGNEVTEIVIVSEGNPARDDEPFRVTLDLDHPENSTVVFRTRSQPESSSE